MIKKILLVTGNDGHFAQKKYPWQSLDVVYMQERLVELGYDVEVLTFQVLQKTKFNETGNYIIYTSSQKIELKKYIEDTMYFFDRDNTLIPSYEALKAHDNKGFQVYMAKKYDLNLIDSNYFSDHKEVTDIRDYPIVFKFANGASSQGVRLIKVFEDLKKSVYFIGSIDQYIIRLKRKIKGLIFKARFNKQWYKYISYGESRFVLQSFVKGLDCDYKVLVFGEKYYILKRFIQDNDFRASGSGLHSLDIGSDIITVLDEARIFTEKYPSHVYSLDICVSNQKAKVIEFQFTHVGPITLTDSNCYYISKNDSWSKIDGKSYLEQEYCNAIDIYINKVTN